MFVGPSISGKGSIGIEEATGSLLIVGFSTRGKFEPGFVVRGQEGKGREML